MLFVALAPCGRVWPVDAVLRRWWRARRGLDPAPPARSRFARWPLELLLIELAFYSFAAGLSQLSASGLAFALGFPLALVLRRLRPWLLAAGVAFHLANHVLLDLIFRPVLAAYPLVAPWSSVVAWVHGPRRRIALGRTST